MLRTVKVPEGMAGAFERAEELVARWFADWRADPERGTIELGGERYVLVRAAGLSVELFALVRKLYGKEREAEADAFVLHILFDLAHVLGKSDARQFQLRMGVEDPIERLSAGPIHFAHAGWAFVEIHPESHPTADQDYLLVYDHPYSFESDAWLRAGERTHRADLHHERRLLLRLVRGELRPRAGRGRAHVPRARRRAVPVRDGAAGPDRAADEQ